jgi:hypothetical protein
VRNVQIRKDPKTVLSFIRDEPAKTDKFGPHGSIAAAMISALEKQSDIRLIGLIGRWGTGKSTIVRQLAEAIQTTHKEKYVVFTYDAWAHQGDPATRSILEELIERLVARKPSKRKMWSETLLEISGSSESSSTITKTRVSGWGKIIIGLLILIPVFSSIIDADTFRRVFADQPEETSRVILQVFIAYLLLLAVFVAAAYAFTLNFSLLKDNESSLWKKLRMIAGSGEDILSIMFTRSLPGSSSTTLRRSQPTTIEFRRFLRGIVESQRPQRIIFVIDNLDRIKPSEALEVWSIMVGMVADETHRMDSKFEPIVILPFDPIALERIVPGGQLQGHSASDLIEKSFDVTFEVPPPVLSNWRAYFAEQYKRCGLLGWTGNSSFEQYWTLRNFENYLRDDRVTPRKINRFLNRVVSLTQQQAANFDPAIVSYYIAHEEKITADCLLFFKDHIPPFDESNAWQGKVAAIAFGTSEAEAAQVLLSDQLIDALTKRDLSAFEAIGGVAGFDEVLRNFVEEPLRDEAGGVDAAPLTALAAFCAKTRRTQDPILLSRLWGIWKNATLPGADNFAPAAMTAFLDAIPNLIETDRQFLVTRIVEQVRTAQDTDIVKELINIGDRIAESAGEDFAVSLGKDAGLLLRIIDAAPEGSRLAAGVKCQCSFEDLAQLILERLSGKIPILAPDSFYVVDRHIGSEQAKGEKELFYRSVGAGLQHIVTDVESPDQTLLAAALVLASRDASELRYLSIISELDDAAVLSLAIDRALENGANPVVSALTALRLTAKKMLSTEELNKLSAWLDVDENAALLLGSVRQMNDGSFLPLLRDIEISGHNVDAILKPLLIQAIRTNDLGQLVRTEWLLATFRKVTGWLNAHGGTVYAKLIQKCGGFADGLAKLSDSDFLLFTSKLQPTSAKALLGERIKKFDAPGLANMIFAGDELWQAYSRLGPDIGEALTPTSELVQALHAVLSGSMGTLGSRTAKRALRFFPLLGVAARNQVMRSSVNSAVERRSPDTIFTLATVDVFSSYISRPSVASKIIAALFSDLKRSRDGQLFIERHATAVANISEPEIKRIRAVLTKALSSRDERTASWARIVLDKSGIDRLSHA